MAHLRASAGSLTPHQKAVLWRDLNDPPGEAPLPIRGALARLGGVEFWERHDRVQEQEWRAREEAHDRWRDRTIAQIRDGLA